MTPPLGHLVGALSASADVAGMTRVLTMTLADLLPAELVAVERHRSLADRVGGRPGTPVELAVRLGERSLVLRTAKDGTTEPLIVHAVRGVVLSRTPVTITAWIEALAGELQRRAAADDRARAALERLLLG